MNRINYFLTLLMLVALSCSGPAKQESKEETVVQEEPKVELPTGDFNYSADSVNMVGYFASKVPAGEKAPGILVIHEWWGHNDYARERADKLADLGYVAMSIDMYGDGQLAEHPDDAGKFAGMVMQNLPLSRKKFEAALAELKNHPSVDPEKIGAIGYCFGGSVALSMANAGYDLDAVAAFHSGVALPIQPEEKPKAKILVCNGADDPFIPAESIDAFKSALDGVEADYEYVSYPGAVHSFTSQEADENGEKFSLPLAYNKEADEDSWKKMQELFKSVF